MSLMSHRTVRDIHGHGTTVVRVACDGPQCSDEVESNVDEYFEWSAVDGFGDGKRGPEGRSDFCSMVCLRAWAIAQPQGR